LLLVLLAGCRSAAESPPDFGTEPWGVVELEECTCTCEELEALRERIKELELEAPAFAPGVLGGLDPVDLIHQDFDVIKAALGRCGYDLSDVNFQQAEENEDEVLAALGGLDAPR